MNIQNFLEKLDKMFGNVSIEEIDQYLTDSLRIAIDEEDYSSYVTIGNEMIGFYRSVSFFDKCFNIAEDTLMLMEELQLDGTIHFATTLINIATAYKAAGKLNESLNYFLRALQIYEQTLPKDDLQFASLYNNMSLLLEQLNENEKAATFLESSISIIEKHNAIGSEFATSKTNLALIYLKLDRDDEAKVLLDEAVQLFDKTKGHEDAHYAGALAGMGEAYYKMKEYHKAKEYYEQALVIIETYFGKNQSYDFIEQNISMLKKLIEEN